MLFPVCVASSTVILVGKRSSAATYISVEFKAQKRKILKNVLYKENDANSKAETLRRRGQYFNLSHKKKQRLQTDAVFRHLRIPETR